MLESNAENFAKDWRKPENWFYKRRKLFLANQKEQISQFRKWKCNDHDTKKWKTERSNLSVWCVRLIGFDVTHNYETCQYWKAMSHPLAPVPLSLCTADGTEHKTVKSKFYDASMSELAIVPEPLLSKSDLLKNYFLDLIAFIRTISSINRSIRLLALQVLKSIPRQFMSIFLVCVTYYVKSIKAGERVSWGQGKCYVLSSPDMKIFQILTTSYEMETKNVCFLI